ncbi:hypothetical protein HBP98_17140 [Listeria booriae]|uniref:Uncharacterized protein n=1 Tax=Listeria booriae TaxID=1552123 RepID=A0A7X1A9G0_9LIST|nr:hypothetical protein [Listeria booriae]MBC2373739.1 hypothetical protein [Listeria booriae]
MLAEKRQVAALESRQGKLIAKKLRGIDQVIKRQQEGIYTVYESFVYIEEMLDSLQSKMTPIQQHAIMVAKQSIQHQRRNKRI